MKDKSKVNETVNHLFRQESGKMVSVLVKIFGFQNLELAEDVVQDALLKALEVWKYNGTPDNPGAWLYRTAKNKAIDIIRRNKYSELIDFTDPKRQLLTSEYSLAITMNEFWTDTHIQDDFLAMMFACCHPDLSPENQITFILKTLCGFSTKEVARSFLTSEDTISKRLYRTKEYFRTHKARLQIPEPEEMPPRINAVLGAIYLIFNEGYNSTHSDEPIRKDLIMQAMSLCQLLLENKKTRSPNANALMALMCFHAARVDGRISTEGELILLDKQDRGSWNQELIESGNSYLNEAASGVEISNYHLEAAIAYEHCIAFNYESTNWNSILNYYEVMLDKNFDPVVYLNRCLVVMEIYGPLEALQNVKKLEGDKKMKIYYLYHAILGTLHKRLGHTDQALTEFNLAIQLTRSESEKQLLREKIASFAN